MIRIEGKPMTAPANLSNRAIEQYADRVGRAYAIYDAEGHANIDELCSRLGGRLEYSDRPESSIVMAPGAFTIYIPRSTSSRRDRFTVAHELGHYFLHYLLQNRQDAVMFGRGARNRAETEANVFASTLLMPAPEFRQMYTSLTGDTWRIAEAFDVSPAAVEVRAQVLGLS